MAKKPKPQPKGHVIKCGGCDGYGKVVGITCPVCGGSGERVIR